MAALRFAVPTELPLTYSICDEADGYLKEFGWTKDEHDSEFDFPFGVKHKYFWVTYKGV